MVTEPITTEETRNNSKDTYQRINHPSFAEIQVSRINGHKVLYSSDFNSHNYIALRIHKSEMIRDLSHDWHHEREQYIEVAMSEAQWATLVSSCPILLSDVPVLSFILTTLPHPSCTGMNMRK